MPDIDRITDLAHLGHHAIFTPTLERTVAYFVDLLGMDVVRDDGDTVYLRSFGDYETWGLKVSRRDIPGLEYVGWRTRSSAASARAMTNGAFNSRCHSGKTSRTT